MITVWSIIDTSVKVGLGVAISGITTYFITKRKQKHEIKRSMLNDKKELLKECAFKIEKSGTIFNHALESINTVFLTTKNKRKELLREQMSEILDAFNEAKEARAIAFLMGESELAKLIESYASNTEVKRQHLYDKRLEYNRSFIKTKTEEGAKIKKRILIKFGKVFESIYT